MKMVGKIGTLQAPNIGPAGKAVDYAFVLVRGWKSAERDEIGRALTELKAASDHNAKVYGQASDALNDLSRKDKDFREDRETERLAAIRVAASQEQARQDIATRRERLERDVAEFLAGRASFESAAAARVETVGALELAVKEREKRVRKDEGVAARAQTKADGMTREAGDRLAGYNGTLAKMREIMAQSE